MRAELAVAKRAPDHWSNIVRAKLLDFAALRGETVTGIRAKPKSTSPTPTRSQELHPPTSAEFWFADLLT